MRNRVHIAAEASAERVLVLGVDAVALAAVCQELMRRGAVVSAQADLTEAAKALRQTAFDLVLMAARPDAQATALFLQLIKAEAIGSPRILLLVDPADAGRYGRSLFQADEMLAATLSPERIVDATGVGTAVEAPREIRLPTIYQQPRTKLLALPNGLSRDLLPADAALIERGEVPDAVVLTGPHGDAAISAWLSAATAAVVPVIDACGHYPDRADAFVSTLNGHGLAEALAAVKPIAVRIKQLPESYFRSRDPKQMLLARLAVRDRAATAVRDPLTRGIVRHVDDAAIAGVEAQAEALARSGHLKRRFFDKLQCCPSCTSARVTVREECAKCRSPDIVDEPIIHHLRCGYNGPERDYRQGAKLVCPKCTHHLEHFSVDYDKPGSLSLCNACGHTTGEPEVGFKCLDCGDGFEAAKAKARVHHEYELTDLGRTTAMAPPLGGYGDDGSAVHGAGSVRERIARFVAHSAQHGTPGAALLIKLDPDGVVMDKVGERRFQQAVSLYASILREIFAANVEIIESATTFLVLAAGDTASTLESGLPEVRRELEQHLSLDLLAHYHIFADQELKTLV